MWDITGENSTGCELLLYIPSHHGLGLLNITIEADLKNSFLANWIWELIAASVLAPFSHRKTYQLTLFLTVNSDPLIPDTACIPELSHTWINALKGWLHSWLKGWLFTLACPHLFVLWCWRLLRVPWTARRSNQSILKEITPGCSLEVLMLRLKLQYFGHLVQRVDSLEKTLTLGGIEGRRRRGW